MAPGNFSLHLSGEGEHSIALNSWQGNRASRCVEGGISRSFWSCSRKPWLPLTYDSDLRELLRVFKVNQEYCGVRGASWDSTGVGAKEEASSRFEAGKMGLFLTCGGKLSVPFKFGRVSLENSGVS